MPAKSKAQQRFMGMVHGLQKGEIKPSDVSSKVKKVAKDMKKKDAEDFASTKHKGLPKKVKEAFLSENPAASAAAAMVMMQMQNPDTGKKIKAITPLKNKDHKLHGKAKGIFKRLKDKFSKKKPQGTVHNYLPKDFKRESVNEGRKAIQAYKEMGSALTTTIYGIKNFRKIINDGPYDKKLDKITGELYKLEIDLEKKLRLLIPQMKKISADKRLESVNEKKNPKREKVKKDFLKSLQTLEKRVKRIKQFAKSNQWGPVSSFVEDGLVYDLRDLEREIDQIISMPVDESVNEGKVEPKVKSRLNVLTKRLTDLKRADTQLEKSMWEAVMEYTKIYNMVKDGKYFETAGFKQLPGSLELNHKRFSQKFSKSLDSIIKSTKDSVKRLQLKESVNEVVNEKVVVTTKKDDIPGNPMKMKGEEKIKKLAWSGSVGMKKPGSYEIKGNKLNVNNIRPRDKGFFVRHFTMGTGIRKANLYYDGVHWQGKKKF